MTLPDLPPEGSIDWYDHYAALDAQARAATATYAAKRYRPSIELRTLPRYAAAAFIYNGCSPIQDNLTTHDDVQWGVWWFEAGTAPLISRRALPDGEFTEFFNMTNVTGNPLAAPVAADGHNYLTVGVSPDGYVHVCGNLHNNAMRYVVCSDPANWTVAASWAAGPLTGLDETSVTYPTFVNLSDGTLLRFYRSGTGGQGYLVFQRWNTTSKTWVQHTKILDGEPSFEGPYWNHLSVDSADNVHIGWNWRAAADTTNNDFCYLKLTNLTGAPVALRSNGAAQALPATHANAEIIVNTADSGSGLTNQLGGDVDSNDLPHFAQYLADSGGINQFQHIWFDGTAWHTNQVTAFATPGGKARPSVICVGERTYMLYRVSFGLTQGALRLLDVTGGPAVSDVPLLPFELADYEPTFDTRAAKERGELHMIVLPQNNAGVASAGYNHENNWARHLPLVASLDLAVLPDVSASRVQLPRLRQTGTIPFRSSAVVSSTSADLPSGASPYLPVDAPGQNARVYVRLVVQGSTTAGTLSVNLREQTLAGVLRDFGTTTFTTSSFVEKATPWMPLLNIVGDSTSGIVWPMASNSGGGSGTVRGRFEVAVLDVD